MLAGKIQTHRWEVVAEMKRLKNLLICSNNAGSATWLPHSQRPQCSPQNSFLLDKFLCSSGSGPGLKWLHSSERSPTAGAHIAPQFSAPVSPSAGNGNDQLPELNCRPSRVSDLFMKLLVSVGNVGDISHSLCLSAHLPRGCNRRQWAAGPWSTAPGTFIYFLFPAAVIHELQPVASWENYIWRFTKIIFSFKKKQQGLGFV